MNDSQPWLTYFLNRLDVWSVSELIRDVTKAIKNGYGNEPLESDPWEDMGVGIEFPDFYIQDFKLPLSEMKSASYQRLEAIRPGAEEYRSDIEEIDAQLVRQGWLLKFKFFTDENGKRKNVCESLTDSNRPLCFVQFCKPKQCKYILKQVNRAINNKWYCSKPYKNKAADVVIKLDLRWFKIGNLSNSGYMGVGLGVAKQFLEEWMVFVNT